MILYLIKEFGGTADIETLLQQKKNKASAINNAVEQCLDDFGFKKAWIRRKVIKNKETEKFLKWIRVPNDLPFPVLNLAMSHTVIDSGGQVFSGKELTGKKLLILTIGYDNIVVDSLVLTKDRKLTHKKGKIYLCVQSCA